MLFNSSAFLIFFPLVVSIYYILPPRLRNIFLLGASCYFYMYFNPVYILILLYTILVDYFAGIKMEQNRDKPFKKKRWLYASLVANLGALVFFKYADFLLHNVFTVLNYVHLPHRFSLLHILLPIGLSFHTFQAISYTVDVYRGKQAAEHNIIVYALYVMFFPQLVAGPIERPQRLIHQFKEVHKFTYENFSIGIKWMAWGLFKKIAVADNLGGIVDAVYQNPHHYEGPPLMVATVLFAFQIYGDFSGYSDIAKGTARILGFDLMTNFNFPYFSRNVSEFWKRWHISLSGWFRDYVYIPLGGSRHRQFRSTTITFALSGMWHGANFTFLIWGLLNGVLVYLDKITGISRIPSVFKIIITFAFIDICWVYFRADSIADAHYIIANSFNTLNIFPIKMIPVQRHIWFAGLAMLLFMLIVEWFSRDDSVVQWWTHLNRWGKLIFVNLLILLLIFFGVFEHRTFIYFQF